MYSTNGRTEIKEKLRCIDQVLSSLWMIAEIVEIPAMTQENHRKVQPPKVEIDSQCQQKKVKWTKVIYSIKMFHNNRVFNSAKVKYIQFSLIHDPTPNGKNLIPRKNRQIQQRIIHRTQKTITQLKSNKQFQNEGREKGRVIVWKKVCFVVSINTTVRIIKIVWMDRSSDDRATLCL